MKLMEGAGVSVYAYGLVIACAAAAALLLMLITGKKLQKGTVSWFALLAVPLAFLGSRIGYCIVNIDWVKEQGFGFVFQLTRGGYMFYGALLGVLAAGLLTGKVTKQKTGEILDAAAAPACLLLAAGRLAEAIVHMGYGHNIEEWFDPWMEKSMIAWEDPSLLYRFPLGAQDYYGDWNFAIFLPETLTALVLLVILLRMKPGKAGGKAVLMMTGYAASQIIWESMRADEVLRWGFVRVNQVLSAVLLLALLILCFRQVPEAERKTSGLTAGLLLLAGGALVVMAMEFALEQKIGFLMWMRMDVCYAVMACACVGLFFSVYPMWKRAYRGSEGGTV